MKKTIQQMIRFGLVGTLNTIIYIVIATIFIKFITGSQVIANCTAFILATCFSYIAHTTYSFRSSFSKKVFVKFIIVTAICFFTTALIAKMAEFLNLNYKLGIFINLSINPLLSYLLHRLWTYRHSEENLCANM